MKLRCRLKAVLADINMSHAEFAEKMGVSPSTVSAWNKGALPMLDKVYMVEEVTGVDLRLIWVKDGQRTPEVDFTKMFDFDRAIDEHLKKG